MNWTAIVGLAEWYTAVHAAGALRGQMGFVVFCVQFLEIEKALGGSPIRFHFAFKFLKPCWLTHRLLALV